MKIATAFPNAIWADTQFERMVGRIIGEDPVLTNMIMESDANRSEVRKAVLKSIAYRSMPAGNA